MSQSLEDPEEFYKTVLVTPQLLELCHLKAQIRIMNILLDLLPMT